MLVAAKAAMAVTTGSQKDMKKHIIVCLPENRVVVYSWVRAGRYRAHCATGTDDGNLAQELQLDQLEEVLFMRPEVARELAREVPADLLLSAQDAADSVPARADLPRKLPLSQVTLPHERREQLEGRDLRVRAIWVRALPLDKVRRDGVVERAQALVVKVVVAREVVEGFVFILARPVLDTFGERLILGPGGYSGGRGCGGGHRGIRVAVHQRTRGTAGFTRFGVVAELTGGVGSRYIRESFIEKKCTALRDDQFDPTCELHSRTLNPTALPHLVIEGESRILIAATGRFLTTTVS